MLKFEHNQIILSYAMSWDLVVATAGTAGSLRVYGSAECFKLRVPIPQAVQVTTLIDRRLLTVLPASAVVATATVSATASAGAAPNTNDAKQASAATVDPTTAANGNALAVHGPWSFEFVVTEPDATAPVAGSAAASSVQDVKSGGAAVGAGASSIAVAGISSGVPAGGVIPISALSGAPNKPATAVHGGRPITASALLADGRVATAASDGSVHVWDKSCDRVMLRLEGGHTSAVTAVCGLLDGRIVTGGADATVRVWTYSKGEYKSAAPLTGHAGPVTAIATWSDNRFATGGADGSIRLYDKYGKCTTNFAAHKGAVTALTISISPDSQWLVSAGADCVIRFWERTRCIVTTVSGPNGGHSTPITAICALPDGRLATGSADGQICVWTGQGQLHSKPATAANAAPVTSIVCVDDF